MLIYFPYIAKHLTKVPSKVKNVPKFIEVAIPFFIIK